MDDQERKELAKWQEVREQFVKKLQEREALLMCPACGKGPWNFVEGYSMMPCQLSPSGIEFGGRTIPAMALACANCGFLRFHALGALGMLPLPEVDGAST